MVEKRVRTLPRGAPREPVKSVERPHAARYRPPNRRISIVCPDSDGVREKSTLIVRETAWRSIYGSTVATINAAMA
ncbi:hypothetical protein [Amycolatopsis minnesotensis]|uniref:hypothetical protein n=1 Tax=Amycolatopsis minnesotensis TaxID=337894 RepID=UPI0031D91798